MSQALIDALDTLESQVANLSGTVKAADPAKISQKAEEGARRGASSALGNLPEVTRALQAAVSDLRQWAVPAARMAQEAQERRRWWKPTLMALAVLLGLLAGFLGGVTATRSGLVMNTEVGCRYLGGSVSVDANGKSFCATWIDPP